MIVLIRRHVAGDNLSLMRNTLFKFLFRRHLDECVGNLEACNEDTASASFETESVGLSRIPRLELCVRL